MRFSIIILLFAGGTITAARLTSPVRAGDPMENTIDYLKLNIPGFYQSTQKLYESIKELNEDPNSNSRSKDLLRTCRLQYKKLSFWLEYFFPAQAQTYNSPAKFELENSSTEFEPPHGMQQIEDWLYDPNSKIFRNQMLDEAKVIEESARDLHSLLYAWTPSFRQIMESIRLELIRVMTLYVEGYDAPFLKSGINESVESLESLKIIFGYYMVRGDDDGKKIYDQVLSGIDYLRRLPDFDHFDRLKFLRDFMVPLERNFNAYLNQKIPGGFYRSIFDKKFAAAIQPENESIKKLGYKLFFEKAISGDGTRSCASCHSPEKYFTDGLARNLVLGGNALLPRNTPTLLYASHQSRQFWDGRASSLDEQIKIVLTSVSEMNSSQSHIEMKLNQDPEYKKQFALAFHQKKAGKIRMEQACQAIASYLRTLSPMESRFDWQMHGNDQCMTAVQKKGFNLFAGKALCATCHFIPLFNGLIPPLYIRSEFEVVGTPISDDLKKPMLDYDSGYYIISPNWFNLGAFKTPTVRNISKTGPYMHNGAFHSLAKVVEFYNKGGGTGLGMQVPNQTLPGKQLGLSKDEEESIVSFLIALTDPVESFSTMK